MEEEGDYIDFLAKYKDWISIRRLGIYPDTRPEEVVFHLAGVRSAIESKAPIFMGIDVSKLDEVAAKLTQGKSKNYQSLSEAIAQFSSKEVKAAIVDACSGRQELARLAEACLLGKVLNSLGFSSSINQEAMSKIFPDLKIKKPLGRSKKKDV